MSFKDSSAAAWPISCFAPAPRPFVLVGVFTEIKIISAFEIFSFMLFEKNKLIPLHFFTISLRPGSKIGKFSKFGSFHLEILSSFRSTTFLSI